MAPPRQTCPYNRLWSVKEKKTLAKPDEIDEPPPDGRRKESEKGGGDNFLNLRCDSMAEHCETLVGPDPIASQSQQRPLGKQKKRSLSFTWPTWMAARQLVRLTPQTKKTSTAPADHAPKYSPSPETNPRESR